MKHPRLLSVCFPLFLVVRRRIFYSTKKLTGVQAGRDTKHWPYWQRNPGRTLFLNSSKLPSLKKKKSKISILFCKYIFLSLKKLKSFSMTLFYINKNLIWKSGISCVLWEIPAGHKVKGILQQTLSTFPWWLSYLGKYWPANYI